MALLFEGLGIVEAEKEKREKEEMKERKGNERKV